MKKIAFYGKGGIGKSTVASCVSSILSEKGYKVLQIGCDPKADSTSLLLKGKEVKTVLQALKENNKIVDTDILHIAENGVMCVEAGGPAPGMGCAGRGIIVALDMLADIGIYEKYVPDYVIYDVLGDVVCGGFAMPMRRGYADKVFIVTSGEKMSLFQARNIAIATNNFSDEKNKKLGGLILNKRNVEDEYNKVQKLAMEFDTNIVGEISRSEDIFHAEENFMTVVDYKKDSNVVQEFINLTNNIIESVK